MKINHIHCWNDFRDNVLVCSTCGMKRCEWVDTNSRGGIK